jgi:hypothetical protein
MTASHQMLSSSGQTAGTVRTAWLTPHGRQSWTAISSILSGCTCAWADLDGFHCEPAPAGPPLATHLWAWSPDRLLRIRLDGTDGIAAELHLTTRPGNGEIVQVTEREAQTWPPREGRVSVDDQWRGRTVRVFQVIGLMPLEFARLHEVRTPQPAGTRHDQM